MSKAVFKYPLAISGKAETLKLPSGARILAFQLQGRQPMMWAEVDPLSPDIERRVQIFGTGHDIPDDADWIGTWQDPPFVWHLYELPREAAS